MNYFTNVMMKQIVIFAMLLIVAVGGCVQDRTKDFPRDAGTMQGTNGGGSPQENFPNTSEGVPATAEQEGGPVSFELPDGWEWMNKKNLQAVLHDPTKNGGGPFVKVEFTGAKNGNEADASKIVHHTYALWKHECDLAGSQCEFQPEFKEMNIAGVKVFAAMDVGYVWGDPTWSSHIAFVKEGRVAEFIWYDRVDQYQNELEKIVTTLDF